MRKSALIITTAAVVASLAGGAAAFAGTQATSDAAGSETAASIVRTGTAPQASDLDAAIEAALAKVGPGTVIEADWDDDSSHVYEIDVRKDSGGVVEVRLDAEFAVVSVRDESSDDDASDDSSTDDDAVTDADARKKAADAALAEVGKGTVVSVELSDDADHVYEVEIDLGDGQDADVELDADFTVIKVD